MSHANALHDLLGFIQNLTWTELPEAVRHQARRCLLDTLGVAAGGSVLPVSRILRDFAARHLCSAGGGVRMLLDGRHVSIPAACMAGAGSIDALDGHDGHVLCKGHVGVTVVPACLGFDEAFPAAGMEDLLTRLVLGYEIGTRAGVALHASAAAYHTSGAWNALAAAAIGARAVGLDDEQTRHALGIAEYYGPRSMMMRVVAHPSMLKDGSTMGAFAGASAALLAADGFTGAPAETVELFASDRHPELWHDLGRRWRVLEQYVKPMPVCRWAQPAAQAVLALRAAYPRMTAADVQRMEVRSFREAVSLVCREPADTDAAQYSLPFATAATLVHGRLTAAELDGPALHDPAVLALSRGARLVEAPDYSARFPAERWAEVLVTLTDGTVLASGPTTTIGDPERPLDDAALAAKFRAGSEAAWDRDTAAAIEALVMTGTGSTAALRDLVLAAPRR